MQLFLTLCEGEHRGYNEQKQENDGLQNIENIAKYKLFHWSQRCSVDKQPITAGHCTLRKIKGKNDVSQFWSLEVSRAMLALQHQGASSKILVTYYRVVKSFISHNLQWSGCNKAVQIDLFPRQQFICTDCLHDRTLLYFKQEHGECKQCISSGESVHFHNARKQGRHERRCFFSNSCRLCCEEWSKTTDFSGISNVTWRTYIPIIVASFVLTTVAWSVALIYYPCRRMAEWHLRAKILHQYYIDLSEGTCLQKLNTSSIAYLKCLHSHC